VITVNRITRALSMGAGILLAVVALIIVADIAHRYVTNRSIPGIIEYSEVTLVAIAYLAFPQAERRMAHIRVDSVTRLLRRRVSLAVFSTAHVVVIVLIAYFAWVTGVEALHSWQIGEYRLGTAQVPIWPARLVIPVSFLFVALQLIGTLVRQWYIHRANGGSRGRLQVA
jgi:TRAP-type mannitol/chloroaromatic compound transport system permease small subunit